MKFKYLFSFLTFLVLGSHAIADNIPEFPFLLANGDAEIKVKPDIAKISFTIIEFNKDSKEAKLSVANRGQALIALTRKLGIDDMQVTSTEYNKSTKRKRDEHYQDLDILGYDVSQNFTVELRDISLYSSFADQLISSQNVENIRTEFKVSNEAEIDRDLLKIATANAKRNASDLASGMGVKLGPMYAVSQDHHFASLEAVFGIYRGSVNAPPDYIPPPSLDFVPDAAGANMFIPKTILLSKSVSVVYRVK
ncbi:MAG: DUF541 domain-containing protein [Gammaproteobacteria bacterium]|nr:MAG: DUF541 domain-containing protein [Gammaproteobacteria bacterium]